MEASEIPNPSVEALLTERLDSYSIDNVQEALIQGQFDPTAAIKVATLKEEEVDGELIRDSGAVVAPDTRVNAHLHSGGEDPAIRDIKGLEAYKILGGKGTISLGYPEKQADGSFVKNEDGSIKVIYGPPVEVQSGSTINVKPGQVHSLRNTSKTDNLVFVFTGSPEHLKDSGDRTMVSNPSEQPIQS